MPEAAVILIEDRRAEAALACTALALRRPEMRVLEAKDVDGAIALLKKPRAPVRLAILGERAVAGAEKLIVALHASGLDVPVVAITATLAEAERRRALEAGVRSVYERPRDWASYSAFMERLVKQWV
jgi:DNA-binding response OmpR family regulator